MTFLFDKWFCCCISLILLLSIPAYAQTNIHGKVVDEKNNAPLPGASVYFNNTTIGTYTNQQGNFNFEAIRLIGTELVIYVPGYEILVFKPTVEQVQGKSFLFKLTAREKSANNKISPSEEVRKAWLNVFKNNFLGITEEAKNCIILNKEAIYFLLGENKSSLAAFADTPLVIINEMLGYKIRFNLEEFWYDDATGQNYFFGYSRYEEIDKSKKSIRNRKRCYGGSTLHFYRSLIAHQLYQQGFGTFLIQPLKDTGTAGLPEGAALMPALDSMMAVPITAQEILYIDSTNNFSIQISGKLLVQYDKEPAAKEYFLQRGLLAGILPKGVESFILFKVAPTGINSTGVLSDYTHVAYSGFWMFERIANMLPYDYVAD